VQRDVLIINRYLITLLIFLTARPRAKYHHIANRMTGYFNIQRSSKISFDQWRPKEIFPS